MAGLASARARGRRAGAPRRENVHPASTIKTSGCAISKPKGGLRVVKEQHLSGLRVTGPVPALVIGPEAVARFWHLDFADEVQALRCRVQGDDLGAWVAADVEVAGACGVRGQGFTIAEF